MKRFMQFAIGVLCLAIATLIGFLSVTPTARAQAEAFQDGFRVIPTGLQQYSEFYYARANGDVYYRGSSSSWQAGPPQFLGNFFFGQPVPSDFLAGLHAAASENANYPSLIYVSSNGNVYFQDGAKPFASAPGYKSFFFGQPVPTDFQEGFHIITGEGNWLHFYYASHTGDVYEQDLAPGGWDAPVYLGNFFNGQPPLATSPSTLGGVKSKYR